MFFRYYRDVYTYHLIKNRCKDRNYMQSCAVAPIQHMDSLSWRPSRGLYLDDGADSQEYRCTVIFTRHATDTRYRKFCSGAYIANAWCLHMWTLVTFNYQSNSSFCTEFCPATWWNWKSGVLAVCLLRLSDQQACTCVELNWQVLSFG